MSRLATLAVHAGRDDLAGLGVHVPPIDLSTTNPVPSVESGGAAYEALATGGLPPAEGGLVYQRLWNPTVARFEDALAALERAEQAVAFGSGMAALTACLIATVSAGKPHIVAVRPLYGGSDHLLATGMLGTEVSWVEPDGVAAAIKDTTGLVIVETPANPTLDLLDLRAVTAAAGDVPVLVDNTFATPVLQRPVEHGATLVLHSATKYLGGHGDVIGGVVAADAEWATRLRGVRAITGGLMHPLAAYLLHRGLQTLPVRVQQQQTNAIAIADWLGGQQHVERVYFPSGELVGRQMSGPGAMVAFAVDGGYAAAARTVEAVRLITHAVSLGGVDSLIQHPASLTHRPVAAHAKPNAAVLRLSVGLEHVDDLVADLEYALKEAHR
ncbi:O-acetylhomoserine sulfhydrylase / O-succinylhomoserine sulfhydrylase [Alloactinosynnema sp. L-07]|uniref:trans-sulfuration enzyme family protein n=1 Tax=Alloactinosynnema sp. L-07 TaxID=1653480 RepID=UPI00065EF210|nr:PLP-dependent aspartate aminotransferase family protein [Alloactinosynnema sp. L-07]CRK59531.1 O-acetylhomoserine sulfhydrylase / O-succinylhomoserine sulfhydrylase [Alloactinosynnema sp. L-07]